MCEAIILVRYETWLRPESSRWPVWLDDQWDKGWSDLAWFETRAVTAFEGSASHADISQLALACCLGYVDFRYPETNWADRFPRIANWYETITLRPSLAETKPQNPPPQ